MPERQSQPDSEIVLYQTEDGRTRVEVRLDGETAWLSLGQMAELFQRDGHLAAVRRRPGVEINHG